MADVHTLARADGDFTFSYVSFVPRLRIKPPNPRPQNSCYAAIVLSGCAFHFSMIGTVHFIFDKLHGIC